MKKKIVLLVVLAALASLVLVNVRCDECGGAGKLAGVTVKRVKCEKCRGSGKSEWKLDKKNGKVDLGNTSPQCLDCRGRGYIEHEVPAGDCPQCLGTGKIKLYQKLKK